MNDTNEQASALTFRTKMDNGSTLSVEILNGDSGVTLADVFEDTVTAIRAGLDVTTIADVQISNEEEQRQAEERSLNEARITRDIENKLDPIAAILNRAHKKVTGARNELTQYSIDRMRALDAGIADFKRREKARRDQEARELADRIREQEEERKREELAALEQQRKKARGSVREQLEESIKAVQERKVDEPVVMTQSVTSKAKGYSGRQAYEVTILDADAFTIAVTAPHVYKAIIAKLEASDLTKGVKAAAIGKLREWLEQLDRIPLACVAPVEKEIKAAAKMARGRVSWPGVHVSEEEKSTKRLGK